MSNESFPAVLRGFPVAYKKREAHVQIINLDGSVENKTVQGLIGNVSGDDFTRVETASGVTAIRRFKHVQTLNGTCMSEEPVSIFYEEIIP